MITGLGIKLTIVVNSTDNLLILLVLRGNLHFDFLQCTLLESKMSCLIPRKQKIFSINYEFAVLAKLIVNSFFPPILMIIKIGPLGPTFEE